MVLFRFYFFCRFHTARLIGNFSSSRKPSFIVPLGRPQSVLHLNALIRPRKNEREAKQTMTSHTTRNNSHDNSGGRDWRWQSPQQNNRRRGSGHGGVQQPFRSHMDSQQFSHYNSYHRSPRGRSRTPHGGPRGRSPHGSCGHYGPQGERPIIPPGSVTGSSPHSHHGPPIQEEEWRSYLTPEGESAVNALENMMEGDRKRSKKRYKKQKETISRLTATADTVKLVKRAFTAMETIAKGSNDVSKHSLTTALKENSDVSKHAVTTMKETALEINSQSQTVGSSMEKRGQKRKISGDEVETETSSDADSTEILLNNLELSDVLTLREALSTMDYRAKQGETNAAPDVICAIEDFTKIRNNLHDVVHLKRDLSKEEKAKAYRIGCAIVDQKHLDGPFAAAIKNEFWIALDMTHQQRQVLYKNRNKGRMGSSSKSLLDKNTELEGTVAGLQKELKRKTDKVELLLEFRVEDQKNQKELMNKVMNLQERNNEYLSENAKLKAENAKLKAENNE